MNNNKLAALTLGATLTAFAAGCETTTTNSNANGNTVPSNVAVATNNNGNANTAGIATTNTGDFDTRYGRDYNYNVNRGDFDRTSTEYGQAARGAGYTIGSGTEDAWIHFKTRAALLATDDLRESTINVDVNNNVVTLRGTVATQAQSRRATEVARGIERVTNVTNSLEIRPNDSMMNTNNTMNGNMNGNMNR